MFQTRLRFIGSTPPPSLILTAVILFLASASVSMPHASIEPPGSLSAQDTPNDPGRSITLTWELSPNDRIPEAGGDQRDIVSLYGILRSPHPETGFNEIGTALTGITEYEDDTADDGVSFYYKVEARGTSGSTAVTPVVGPVMARGQVFDTRKSVLLAFMLLFCGSVLFLIRRARAGKEIYIRPIPGLSAVDEAIGRATEMGRPILFVPGLGVSGDVATLAAYTMLGRIAHKTAEYQTNVLVPCYDPMVMTIAQDVVKSAYLDAGYPDMYKEDDVFFVTQDQFSYVAAVNGLMIREKPATNFYIGKFYAESLILAETGNIAGSIQIAGTDEIIQIPFFVAACDYTLIGEELYAASAYLSREPALLGTLKGQDWGKASMMILIILGVLAATFGWDAFVDFFATQ